MNVKNELLPMIAYSVPVFSASYEKAGASTPKKCTAIRKKPRRP